MDERTRLMIVSALRNPDSRRVMDMLNQPNSNYDNLPDKLGIRSYSAPTPAPHRLPTASGQDLGGVSLDARADKLSLQNDGKIGNGSYYAELNKPFNGDINARLKYLLPHKNGYFEANGDLKPGNSSFFVNYKTNF